MSQNTQSPYVPDSVPLGPKKDFCASTRFDFTKQVAFDKGGNIYTVWHHTGPHLKTIDNPMSDPNYNGYFLMPNQFHIDYNDYFPKTISLLVEAKL